MRLGRCIRRLKQLWPAGCVAAALLHSNPAARGQLSGDEAEVRRKACVWQAHVYFAAAVLPRVCRAVFSLASSPYCLWAAAPCPLVVLLGFIRFSAASPAPVGNRQGGSAGGTGLRGGGGGHAAPARLLRGAAGRGGSLRHRRLLAVEAAAGRQAGALLLLPSRPTAQRHVPALPNRVVHREESLGWR